MATLVQMPMKRRLGVTMPAPAGTVPLPASVQRPSSSSAVRRKNEVAIVRCPSGSVQVVVVTVQNIETVEYMLYM